MRSSASVIIVAGGLIFFRRIWTKYFYFCQICACLLSVISTMTSFIHGSYADVKVVMKPKSAHECLQLQDKTQGNLMHEIGPFQSNFQLTTRQCSILHLLKNFYTEDVIKTVLLPLLDQSSPISLRALDWLVTNYSKKFNVICTTKSGDMFNIHQGYRTALNMNRRRNFDPFRRRLRLNVVYSDGSVESTVGQLNFLHWAYQQGVFEYLDANITDVDADMNACAQKNKKEKEQGKRKRRVELSRAPTSKCMVYNVETKVVFHS